MPTFDTAMGSMIDRHIEAPRPGHSNLVVKNAQTADRILAGGKCRRHGPQP